MKMDEKPAKKTQSKEALLNVSPERLRRLYHKLTAKFKERTHKLEDSLALVRATLESTTDGILVVDQNWHMIDCNQKFVQMWGIPQEIIDTHDDKRAFEHVINQVTNPKELTEQIENLYTNEEEKGGLTEVHFKDGRVFERYTQPHVVNGQVVGRVWSFRDVTARKKAEQELRIRESAISSSADGIIIVDMKSVEQPIIYVNHAFEKITGYKSQEVIGRNCRFLQKNDLEQPAINSVRTAVREGREEQAELRNYRKDGQFFWNELHIAPVRDTEGKITHYVGIVIDITERKNMEMQLLYQATHDTLTKLPNRSLLSDRINQAIAYAHRDKSVFALIFLDLDRFKLVNDTMGHPVGDELLKNISKRLIHCVRESDTVARIGGDEFVIIVNDLKNESLASISAAKVLQAVAAPMIINESEMTVTASAGIVVYPRDGEDVATILRNADTAMYRAKEAGRNNFQFFTAEMNKKMFDRFIIENELRRALQNNELQLYYQPFIDLRTQRIVGAEALLRWVKKGNKIILPSEFIGIAEESGLIIPIGEWVVKTAFEQLKRWQDLNLKNFTLAINVSPRQFNQSNFVTIVTEIAKHCHVEPESIELEVTEGILMEHAEETVAKLNDLKKVGFNLAIDDFGTGYSNLNYLKRFPVDKMKIDRSFIKDLPHDKDDAAITLAIIRLAKTLGMNVIAEGVEKKEQLDFLIINDCDEVQGFYFSKPIDVDKMTTLLLADRDLISM